MGLANWSARLSPRRLGLSLGIPLEGKVVHFKPDGFVVQNGLVTGWANEVSGLVVPVFSGSTPYNAPSAVFNGHASVSVTNVDLLGGVNITQSVGAEAGITIFCITKMTPFTGAVGQNADGCMLWFMDAAGAINIWTGGSNSRTGLGVNTFAGDLFGEGPLPTVPDVHATRLVTTRIISGSSNTAQIYINGRALVMSGPGHATRAFTGIVYPGQVPPQTRYSFEGQYAEFLVYNRVVSDSELSMVHTYLRNKFAL